MRHVGVDLNEGFQPVVQLSGLVKTARLADGDGPVLLQMFGPEGEVLLLQLLPVLETVASTDVHGLRADCSFFCVWSWPLGLRRWHRL
jgi:hypothetical protein